MSEARARAEAFVSGLQEEICAALETFEPSARFREDRWERPGGGGGRTRVLTGEVFEKAGVNVSAVWGEVPEAVRAQMPGDGETFFATGISLVLHPRNPHAPTTHANFRYLERGSVGPIGWFGGGADLTPYVLYEEDAAHFHGVFHDAAGEARYRRFKAWCDRYFWNTHRQEARGVGGIFYDHMMPGEEGSPEELFAFWQATGRAFLPSYLPILERRKDLPADDALREWQLVRRGRYVEFNLLHDRGTKFGLSTGGRVESILMSLPPLVRWDYDRRPEPGSPESRLVDVLMHPREWVP